MRDRKEKFAVGDKVDVLRWSGVIRGEVHEVMGWKYTIGGVFHTRGVWYKVCYAKPGERMPVVGVFVETALFPVNEKV